MSKQSIMACLKKNENGVPSLYVDGKPYLIFGGELHNSSASSLQYMEKCVWPYLRGMHLNTVLLPVSWESLEPQDGCYDDTLVKGLLAQAHRENVKLIILWFGLWKNYESIYVPEWVKTDTRKFFRAIRSNASATNIISPFCEEAVERDRQAFCHLMKCIKEVDRENTVIMVQIENEMGIMDSERDFSAAAETAFAEVVPEDVAAKFSVTGTWEEAFGEKSCEYFMAYYYAKAVERIAAAGKKIYPLPMYVNAWIEKHPLRAGAGYPSGGPVASMIPMWQLAAPSIDLCAPDIYVQAFRDVCENFSVHGNPLFIPETRRDAVSVSNVLYVFGKLNGLGFSPFGIEDFLKKQVENMGKEQLADLNISSDAFNDRETASYLSRSYEILSHIQDKLVAFRGSDRMTAFLKQGSAETGCIIAMDDFDLQLDYISGMDCKTGSGGIIFREDNGFYIIGCNVKMKILPKAGRRAPMGILRYEEGEFIKGEWKRGRILNGDEILHSTNAVLGPLKNMPECRFVKVYERI